MLPLGTSQAARSVATVLMTKYEIQPEQRVLLLLPSQIDYVSAFFGVIAAGGTAVPLDARFTKPEVERVVRAAGTFLAIASPSLRPQLNGLELSVVDSQSIGIGESYGVNDVREVGARASGHLLNVGH